MNIQPDDERPLVRYSLAFRLDLPGGSGITRSVGAEGLDFVSSVQFREGAALSFRLSLPAAPQQDPIHLGIDATVVSSHAEGSQFVTSIRFERLHLLPVDPSTHAFPPPVVRNPGDC